MEASISAQSLRTFVKALACLQKFGDDCCLSASSGELKLSTVSATRSAFAMFALDKGFFQRYEVTAAAVGGTRRRDDTLQVQFAAKALLAVLKPRTVSSTVESCTLSLKDEEMGEECRLVVKLFCRHGVVKTHRLNYASTSALFPLASRDTCTSSCIVSPVALHDWTEHFWTGKSIGIDEITFWCSDSFCKLRNYENAEFDASKDKGKGKAMSTTLSVDLEDFDEYNVATEQLITFSLKELKAIVAFADAASSQVDMAFSIGGEPVLFNVRGDSVNADFVIATTADDPSSIKEEKPDVRAKTPAQPNGRHHATVSPPRARPPAQPPPASQATPAANGHVPLFRAESQVPDSQNVEKEFDDMGDMDEGDLERMEAEATQAASHSAWNLHND